LTLLLQPPEEPQRNLLLQLLYRLICEVEGRRVDGVGWGGVGWKVSMRGAVGAILAIQKQLSCPPAASMPPL